MVLKALFGLIVVRPLIVWVFAKALQFAWEGRIFQMVAATMLATFLIERNSMINEELKEEAERLRRL